LFVRQANQSFLLYNIVFFTLFLDAAGLSSKGKAIVADERASAFNRLYHRIVDVYGNDKALDIYSTLLMMTLTLNVNIIHNFIAKKLIIFYLFSASPY